jgi:hypothetical protein
MNAVLDYNIIYILLLNVGPDTSVGIAIRYGLDGPTIESRFGGEIFLHRPDRPWGPPSLLYNVYRVFTGVKAAGALCWPPPPFSVLRSQKGP